MDIAESAGGDGIAESREQAGVGNVRQIAVFGVPLNTDNELGAGALDSLNKGGYKRRKVGTSRPKAYFLPPQRQKIEQVSRRRVEQEKQQRRNMR